MSQDLAILPECLFKYRHFPDDDDGLAWLKSLITKGVLYHAEPRLLNDPFECNPCWVTNATQQQLQMLWSSKASGEALGQPKKRRGRLRKRFAARCGRADFWAEKWGGVAANFGVFSVAQRADSVLMWAHYTDQFRGVCVELALKQHFENSWDVEARDRDKRLRPVRVDYGQVRPKLETSGLAAAMLGDTSALQQLARVFEVKADDWSYEQEWRLIRSFTREKVRAIECGGNIVRTVLLGPRIRPEYAKLVRSWVSSDAPHIQVRQARLSLEDFKVVLDP